jgi:Glycerophosphoryl diester phosphodiesterase family
MHNPPLPALSRLFWSFVASLLLFLPRAGAQPGPVPLTRVHAHNDYEHPRPLLDALDHGFCSVEADVYLVKGKLLVAHERFAVRPGRTLQALYLDPLRERVQSNGGCVFPHGPEFTLLVDFKENWRILYPALRDCLRGYTNMLSCFHDGMKETNAITVIISGNRSPHMFDGERVRYAALDGDVPDLDSGQPATLIPWISSNWYRHFKWNGAGPMPPAERSKLRELVARAHQQGRRVRFWGAPDRPAFWRELYDDGVDLLNTDDLAGAQKFLLSQRR